MVAEAINELSGGTTAAVAEVSSSIATLGDWTAALREDAETLVPEFRKGLEGAEETRLVVGGIAEDMSLARTSIERIAGAVGAVRDAQTEMAPIADAIGASAHATSAGVATARTRLSEMATASEHLLQTAIETDPDAPDRRFVHLVQSNAADISARMEAAVADGDIGRDALFDFTYVAIPGSDPAQHEAPFARFTDGCYQDVLEAALGFDSRVLFSAACDRNGYIPTHNIKFSRPQGPDAGWNTAHCRNRRIFDDPTGLRAGRNTAPFIVQVYRRDMGAEGFVLMKDVSAPIHVNGRHWGGLRLGYRAER